MRDKFRTFTHYIGNINRSIQRLKTEIMSRFRLRRSHLSCIYYIYREGAASATRLCALCGEDKSNISRTLKSLEDDGYILRESRTTPRARVRVTLSPKGIEIGEFLASQVDSIVEAASTDLSDEEIRIMYSSLESIDRNLTSLVRVCDED